MELIQIGSKQPEQFVTIRELFERMARRESETILAMRERAERQTSATGQNAIL